MSALTRISALSRSKCSPISGLLRRNISTSKKKQETATINPSLAETATTKPNEEKNWISYGFCHHNKEDDRHFMHGISFMFFTVIVVWGGMNLAYRPDDLGRDWAQREGFLELRRREKLGLPLVDPNYLPLDQIILPSDEELGNTEVVI